jgi:putative spermidine/putrescine transport system ATP-binding protein
MKDGRVRQIGAPAEIYAQPADLDVARFMGYRNELALTAQRMDGADVVLDLGLRGRAMGNIVPGARVKAAIRPEDLSFGDGPLRGRVENIEYGGRDSLVDVVTADGVRLHVRTAAPARLGDNVALTFPSERLLVYEG